LTKSPLETNPNEEPEKTNPNEEYETNPEDPETNPEEPETNPNDPQRWFAIVWVTYNLENEEFFSRLREGDHGEEENYQ